MQQEKHLLSLSSPQQSINPPQQQQQQVLQIPSDEQIISLIQKTYKINNNTETISEAQEMLGKLLENQLFVGKLFKFLQTECQRIQALKSNLNNNNNNNNASSINKYIDISQNGNGSGKSIRQQSLDSENFCLSVSLLIRKFSYNYSKNPNTPKNEFLEQVFKLIMSPLAINSKLQLGTALQYILNHQTKNEYKLAVIEKVVTTLDTDANQLEMEGGTICAVSCLNSLIEADDHFDFLLKMIQPVIKNLIKIRQALKSRPEETLTTGDSLKLMKLAHRLFDFLELAISRIIQDEDVLQKDSNLVRQHLNLHIILLSYLGLFGLRNSIISSIPAMNQIKEVIIQLIFHLFRQHKMPEPIFNELFVTMLLECSKPSYQQQQEHIVSRIIQIIEIYMTNEFFTNTFLDHKMQILIEMLSYSVTKQDQIQLIEDQAEKFVELAEEFTQGFQASLNIKVRAGALLRVFVKKFDEALRNVVQIVVIIITAATDSDSQESPCLELYQSLKGQFPQFQFFSLHISTQLECCFNIVSLLNLNIKPRSDLNKVIYALLVTHMGNMMKIQRPLVVLRLIRLIGYYPTAIYYPWIQQKMAKGKVFILQSMKSFERILKQNKYPEIFQMLAQMFHEILNMITINDSLFEIIILNHYDRVIKKNLSLFKGMMQKIRDAFINNLEAGNQHTAILALGYVQSAIRKETQPSYRRKIIQYFSAMQEYHTKVQRHYQEQTSTNTQQQQQKQKLLRNLSMFDQKLIQIYVQIATKQPTVDNHIVEFALKKINDLTTFDSKSQIFLLYNTILLKIDGTFNQQVQPFYKAFMSQIKKIFERNDQISKHIGILPNICFLISQIYSCFLDVKLKKNDLFFLLKIIDFVEVQIKQYVIMIVLSYLYIQPVQVREMLMQQNCYEETLKMLLTAEYDDKVISKIFLLAMSKLLEIQQRYFQDIIKQCLLYFKQQNKLNSTKLRQPQHPIDPKLRRVFQDVTLTKEEMMQEDHFFKKNQATVFFQFKHPLVALSQYDQFKIRVWQNINVVGKLAQGDKEQLREILQMDWFGKGVRKIVSVKQQQQDSLEVKRF